HWKPLPGRKLAHERRTGTRLPAYPSQIDFAGGIAAQADAIQRGIAPGPSGKVALHITELALALSNAGSLPQPYRLRSTF
ncbi:MAG: Gfo/Idh/MocA family protein, partial [Phyllobacterium sp.]